MNFAHEKLQTVIKLAKQYNWLSYSFPSHRISIVRLVLINTIGEELLEKTTPSQMHKPHMCWINSVNEKKKNPTLQHWQGFIANVESAWPTPHAWNVLDGKIWDTTVDAREYDYFGFNVEKYPEVWFE